jgi:hypothetical protein
VNPPATRPEILAEIGRLAAEVERIAGIFDTRTFFAPQYEDGTARWSPAQQVRHLTKATYPLARAFDVPRLALMLRFGVSLHRRGSYPELVRRYEHVLADRPQAGRFAPDADATADDARRAEIMGKFRDAVSKLCAAADEWSERALDRYRLPHPLLGNLTTREMLWFTVFHTAHHGGQMDRRRGTIGP